MANVSVRMAWISFGALPCREKKTWQLASRCCWNRASLTCFRACFLPGRAKDLSAPGSFGCKIEPSSGHYKRTDKLETLYIIRIKSCYCCCSCVVAWWWLEITPETSSQVMLTSSMFCVADNWINIHLCFDTPKGIFRIKSKTLSPL